MRQRGGSSWVALIIRPGAPVDARTKQCLVGVDVPDPGDRPLVEDDPLDRRLAATKRVAQDVRRERLGSSGSGPRRASR